MVRVGDNTLATLTLNTGVTQGRVLSPLLYSLFTHDCVAAHTTPTPSSSLPMTQRWCQDNNLSLNVGETKELIMDNRKQRAEHATLHIDGAVVERAESFKFLGVHIAKELSWSKHINTVVKRAHQRLFTLMRLKRFGMVTAQHTSAMRYRG